MEKLSFDLRKTAGVIKPVNAVNNGPVSQTEKLNNFEEYKAIKPPYARLHDSAAFGPYGGEWSVDVHRIFRNFDADENDPKSYVFGPTDLYLKAIVDSGTEPLYRLGALIEPRYKYGTYPPKDFAKWARICEHIIMHYTEGWADGFNYKMEYWELWNEPDNVSANGTQPCWQGTLELFCDFYEVAAKHLKSRFPHLKIGGPSICDPSKNGFALKFLKAVKEREIPLDFFSYHGYIDRPELVRELCEQAKETCAIVGLPAPELFYNEWNYLRAWTEPEWSKSRKESFTQKGSSFNVAAMCVGQSCDVSMMNYYDARPSSYCGLFDMYFFKTMKPYYGFLMFAEMKELKGYVPTVGEAKNVYSCCSCDGRDGALVLTHFDAENDLAEAKELELAFTANGKLTEVEYVLSNAENDFTTVRKESFDSESFSLRLTVKPFDCWLIRLRTVEN